MTNPIQDEKPIACEQLRQERDEARIDAERRLRYITECRQLMGTQDSAQVGIERLIQERDFLRVELAASQERERKLRDALKRVWRIATGEDQVAQDDTDAMGVIAAEVRVVIAAALATPETKEKQ